MKFFQSLHSVWVSAVVGALSGLFAVPLAVVLTDKVQSYWEAMYPIATGVAQIVGTEKNAVFLRVTIQKLEEGSFLRITAYDATDERKKIPLNIERIDEPQTNITHPVGTIVTGVWRVWPTKQPQKINLYVNYAVNDRVVPVLVGTVNL